MTGEIKDYSPSLSNKHINNEVRQENQRYFNEMSLLVDEIRTGEIKFARLINQHCVDLQQLLESRGISPAYQQIGFSLDSIDRQITTIGKNFFQSSEIKIFKDGINKMASGKDRDVLFLSVKQQKDDQGSFVSNIMFSCYDYILPNIISGRDYADRSVIMFSSTYLSNNRYTSVRVLNEGYHIKGMEDKPILDKFRLMYLALMTFTNCVSIEDIVTNKTDEDVEVVFVAEDLDLESISTEQLSQDKLTYIGSHNEQDYPPVSKLIFQNPKSNHEGYTHFFQLDSERQPIIAFRESTGQGNYRSLNTLNYLLDEYIPRLRNSIILPEEERNYLEQRRQQKILEIKNTMIRQIQSGVSTQ